jgi:NADH:ubiquinone oxidoreductase subunit E
MLNLPVELATEHTDLIAAIDALVDAHGSTRSALLPVLQGLREQRHEINDVAMQVVADRLGITPVDVQGVVTFYSFLKMEAAGKHIVHVCRTLSCEMAGMRRVADQLQAELGVKVGGTSADDLVTLEWVNCIGMCDQPPAVLVDRKALGRVTPAQVREIIAGLRAGAATAD